MHYNIFVKSIFAAILTLFAVSCVERAGIDEPAGRVISVPPSTDGKINVQVVCRSDVKEYILVNCQLRDRSNRRSEIRFDKEIPSDTLTFSWLPGDGHYKAAFRATKLQSTITRPILGRDKGITFDVEITFTTPSDGVRLNWASIDGEKLSSSSEFWKRTITAVNEGLPWQTPGTGESRYVDFVVAPNEHGEYGISVGWTSGNLFE